MFESEGAGAYGKSHWLKAEPSLIDVRFTPKPSLSTPTSLVL